jgi:bifunctional UDP-N-acetylglucosamine pyrophosphorylase/glucosamine-1-phosphate N-acetyltransferase
MREGVTMTDPARTYVDASVELEPDAHLLPGSILEGRTVVGSGAVIGPDTHLVDTIVGERAIVRQTVARDTEIGDDVTCGPYAHLRPGTRIAARAHIGNFVEIKNARIEAGAKANHLSYIGDARVGAGSNIGAGTITCNYDGFGKHWTDLGERVFIGSNASLVAPLTIGDGAIIGAGSTIDRDVPPDGLSIGRARQTDFPDGAARFRARKSRGST